MFFIIDTQLYDYNYYLFIYRTRDDRILYRYVVRSINIKRKRNNYLPILKRGREGSRLSCRADNDDMHAALNEKLHTINVFLIIVIT